MAEVLAATDKRVRQGERAVARLWPTGFTPLDEYLDGGMRAGELVLVGGSQGVGKTTFALQLFRNVAASGGSALYFSFEHDETSVLQRLLVQEAYGLCGGAAPTLQQLRRSLESRDAADGAEGLASRLSALEGLSGAQLAVQRYGGRLAFSESSGRHTTMDVVRELVLKATENHDQPVVFVDYLQKVSVAATPAEDDRTALIVESLKDLALEMSVAVIAIVAATQEGIAPGNRLRVHELRGSSALAYEADVILLMNNKYDIVAKRHISFDPRSAERFRRAVVITIEKNRSGRGQVDLEFAKQFEHCRFDPIGNLVAEQLVDERVQD